jgi:S-adenosylmethionine hydrolase
VITLLTDFGQQDGFVGIMKGVILGFAPDAQIVDITHDLKPQDVDAGAFVLRYAHRFFPDGTIHVAVVDPGVGSSRRILAAQAGSYTFLAPDNGLLKYIWRAYPEPRVHIVQNSSLFLPRISQTFHGRDIFAPVAGRLAAGLPLAEVGPVADDYQRGQVPEVQVVDDEILATVLHIDRFGNVITNVPAERATGIKPISLQVRGRSWPLAGLAGSYVEGQPGQPLVILGSSDFLEVAVREDSAAQLLRVRVGDIIRIRIEKTER